MWLLAAFAWWVRYHPPGMNLLVFDDDARQHVYWSARYQDPALFPDDLLTDFVVSSGFEPPGYRLLYRLGTRSLEPLPFSQLLTLLLLLLSLWLLYQLAGLLIPTAGGRIVCGGLFLFYSLYHASGGFPRSFCFPLLLAYLVLWQKGAYRRAVAAMPAAALLYPPAFLNIMALAAWAPFSRRIRLVKSRSWRGNFLFFLVAVLVAGVLLFPVYRNPARGLAVKRTTLEEAKTMPEFYPGGRSVFFRGDPASYYLLGRSGIGAIHLAGFVIILAAMGIAGGFRRLRIPAVSVHLVWTSIILFGIAHLLLFRLHLPSRYTLYTIPLAFMVAIGASWPGFAAGIQKSSGQPPVRILGVQVYTRLGCTALVLLALGYPYLQGHYICRLDPQMVCLDREDLQMLAFLQTLPKDALVAGHPMDMDNVPLIARRKVLASHELALPYYLGYYRQVRDRTLKMLQAYYAGSWEKVQEFIGRYGVDAIVVRKAHFHNPFLQGRIYFEPFNQIVKGRWQAGKHFALANPPQKLRCFENDRYLVLCCSHT